MYTSNEYTLFSAYPVINIAVQMPKGGFLQGLIMGALRVTILSPIT